MRGNSGIIGSRQTISSSSASGLFSLIDQQINRGAGLWPITSPPSLNSIFFDGTGDYITFSATGDFAKDAFFGLGKTFTVEAWIYPTSLVTEAGYFSVILCDGNPSGVEMCWNVGMDSAKKPAISWYDGASKSASVSTALTLSVWTHVAWVASAGSVSIYVNGVSQALTGTTTLTNSSQTVGMEIGVDRSRTIAGYISNLRAVKGTAIYTSNFTLPIQNLTNVANTSLLLGTTNSVTDASTNNRTLTLAGQVAANTTFAPHIPASISLDGTGDYLSTPNASQLQMGSGDFTIEFWIRYSSISGFQTPYSKGYTATGDLLIQTGNGNGRLIIYASGVAIITETGTASINTWIHYALVRSGSTVTLYRDGVSSGSATSTVNFNTTDALGIGATGKAPAGGAIGDYAVNGYMSNIRVVKGTALYTSNFTPSTTNLTNVTNTSILLGQYQAFTLDFSDNRLTITKSGNATYSTSVLPF